MLHHRALVITGGGRGIGAATAVRAAQHGWSLILNYRERASAAEAVVAQVRASGGRAIAVAGDVAQESDVVSLFDAAEREFGVIAGVVNNAGVVAEAMPLAEMSAARIERMFAVNIFGAFLVAREAARRLSRTRGGHGGSIVNVSSAASRLGSPGEYVDYAASKGAIDTLTLGLSKELAVEGVRVNAVRPGLIETEIHRSSGDPCRAERLGRSVPWGRAGAADEVAQAIVWLLSEQASYVTGALLDVSGGR
jgi:NAD(P)-dependent dehydrogenase (short-subunit alcohol dehydrogenase family)